MAPAPEYDLILDVDLDVYVERLALADFDLFAAGCGHRFADDVQRDPYTGVPVGDR